jgi:hypothetical protein
VGNGLGTGEAVRAVIAVIARWEGVAGSVRGRCGEEDDEEDDEECRENKTEKDEGRCGGAVLVGWLLALRYAGRVMPNLKH